MQQIMTYLRERLGPVMLERIRPTRFPTGFHVSRGTLDTRCQLPLSRTGLSPSVAGLPMPFC